MDYKKPQDTLVHGGIGLYPLTTADQVILADGGRLEKAGKINADKLGGRTLAEIMLEIYPVGAVYISVNSTSPASLFGGTWEQIKGRFLIGTEKPENNDDGKSPGNYNFAAGSKGGEATHTLTNDEIPAHDHSLGHTGNHSSFSVTWGNIHANVEVPSAIAVTHTPGQALTGGNSLVVFQNEDHVTATSGGGAAHNNLPPYMAVYMWKRVS